MTPPELMQGLAKQPLDLSIGNTARDFSEFMDTGAVKNRIAQIADALRFLAGDPLAILVTVFLCGYGLLYVLGPPALVARAVSYATILLLITSIWAMRRSIHMVTSARERTFWNVNSLAFLIWLINECFDLLFPSVRQTAYASMGRDILYVLTFATVLLSTAERPRVLDELRFAGSQDRMVSRIGLVIFAVGLVFYFVLIPVRINEQDYLLKQCSYFLYIAFDLIVAIRFLCLAGDSKSKKWKMINLLWSTAFFSWGSVDLMDAISNLSQVKIEAGSILDFFWFLPFGLIVFSARLRSSHALSQITPRLGSWVKKSIKSYSLQKDLLMLGSLVLMLFHFAGYSSGILDKASKPAREVCVFSVLFGMLVLARATDSIQSALMKIKSRYVSLIHNATDIILIVSPDLTTLFATPSIERVLGFNPDEIIGTKVHSLFPTSQQQNVLRIAGEVFSRKGETRWETICRRKDGSELHVEITAASVISDPTIEGIILTIHDVHQRKLLQDQLMHQALHDTLTQLPNRALFNDRLQHSLMKSLRRQAMLAILVVDLDYFKDINDALGHGAGDTILREVAKRLAQCIREQDTVARLGADEFGILLDGVHSEAEVRSVTERLHAVLRPPFSIDGKDINITASIGVAMGVHAEDTPSSLLQKADVALYLAKQKGIACYAVFDQATHKQVKAEIVNRIELGTGLQQAIERKEFLLQYQPIISLQSRLIIGVEALVRWQHPVRGRLLPSSFIPLAEKTGLIVPLGRYVLREACQAARSWITQGLQYVSVNVSGRQLQDSSLIEHVVEALGQSGLEPRRLVLEVTETVLMTGQTYALEQLQKLKALGVSLAIDDFGTGYSSLSYLSQLPANIIKIDKSFSDRSSSNLMRGIVELVKAIGLVTVVEGVEHGEQVQALKEMGCTYAQGFHFAVPLDPDHIDELLQQQNCETSIIA